MSRSQSVDSVLKEKEALRIITVSYASLFMLKKFIFVMVDKIPVDFFFYFFINP